MDIGKSLHDSSEYAKDVVWGKWVRWILLIFCTLFFPLLLGYEVEIYRGNKPAPDWCKLERFFIEGLKLFIIELIYAIPVIIAAVIFIGGGVVLAFSGSTRDILAMVGPILIGVLITLIVAIVIGLVEAMGVVRFARLGRMGEAFNFGAIFETIGKIGWFSYILAMIAMFIVVFIITVILSFIPILGPILLFIIAPALAIFAAQYITLVYDSVPTEAPPASPPAT